VKSLGYPMSDPKLLLLAAELRARAEEILTRAGTFHDADARRKLHGIAATYMRNWRSGSNKVPSTWTSRRDPSRHGRW